MSAILKSSKIHSVFDEISCHEAWYGDIAGLSAEKLLRGRKTPYLFILRQGEKSSVLNEQNYYVTFIHSDLSVKHQPLVVTADFEAYYFENGNNFGPCYDTSIDDVLHLVMHCEKGQCQPLIK